MGQTVDVDGKKYTFNKYIPPESMEEAKKYIRDQEFRKGFEAKPDWLKAATLPGLGFNRGLAGFVGAPVDLMAGAANAALNAPTQRPDVEPYSAQMGLPETTRFKDPIGGSANIKSLAARGNMAYPSMEAVPEEYRPLARAFETVGESVPGALLPFLGAARVPAAAQKAKGTFAPMVNAARDKPGQTAFVEATATGGAAMGAGIAESVAPGDPWARMAGELGLGMASPFAMFGKTAGALLGRAKGVVEQLKGTFDPMYGASKHVQESAALFGESPQDLIRALREPDAVTRLPAGAKTGSLTLNALEHKLIKTGRTYSITHGKLLEQNIAEINAAFRELQDIGSPEALQELAKLRRNHYDNMLELFENNAVSKAQASRESIVPASPDSPAAANVQANKVLRGALDDARGFRDDMWGRVPRDLDTPQEGLLGAWKASLDGLLKGEKLHLSGPVRAAYLKAAKGKTPPKSGELLTLRQRLANEIRLERGDGLGKVDWDRIRRMEILKDQIDENIAKVSPEAAAARDFSVAMHDRFTRSYAGEVLGRKPTGEEAIKPEMTLERGLVPGQGPSRSVVSKELESAAAPFGGMQDNPQRLLEMREAEEQIIRRMATQGVADPITGGINPKKLEAFRQKNYDLLQRFPEFDKVLSDASIAEQVYGRRFKRIQAVKDVRDKMAFSKILGAEDVDVVFRDALGGRFPVRDTSSIFKTASKTPQARAGARTAYLEHLFNSSAGPDGLYSGEKFIENLMQSNGEILKQARRFGVLSDGQIDRLMQIAGESKRLESSMKFKGELAGVMENPNAMIDLLSRLVGANIGGSGLVAQSSGAGLVMASAGSRYVRKMTEQIPAMNITKILRKAVEDKDLMITLLETPVTPGKGMAIAQKLKKQLADGDLLASGGSFARKGVGAGMRAMGRAVVTPPLGYKLQAGVPAQEER